MIYTAISNFFVTRDTTSLVETFLSCAAAAKLLDSGRFQPILVDSSSFLEAETSLDDDNPNSVARISIPKKNLGKTKALEELAFEIFNAQTAGVKEYFGLEKKAELENMEMDLYARQYEEQEYARTKQHFKLISQCAKIWKLPSERLKDNTYFENRDFELHFFNQEYACHTDVFRQEWINKFQKTYCKKHPDDTRSCMTKKADLCDFNDVAALSSREQRVFLNTRICKLFPQAHEKVKNDPAFRKVIKKTCPEILSQFRQDL